MKNYIAPEMEIAKFAAEDVITTLIVAPAIKFNESDPTYNFRAGASYDTF